MKNNKFRFTLIVLLAAFSVALLIINGRKHFFETEKRTAPVAIQEKIWNVEKTLTVMVFHKPYCLGCQNEIRFIEKKLKPKYPWVKFEYHEITTRKEKRLMLDYYVKYNADLKRFATPTIFIGKDYFIGYSPVIAGKIEASIKAYDSPAK